MTQPLVLPAMNEQQRATFVASYRAVEKDSVTGVLLAVFLGGFGAHHFYLGRNGAGLLYLLFSWTGVTYFIAWVEAFFMPGRVRRYNEEQAAYLASVIVSGSYVPVGLPMVAAMPVTCPACGSTTSSVARFCAKCGATLNLA